MPIMEISLMLAFGAVLIFLKLPQSVKKLLIAVPLLTDIGVTYIFWVMHGDTGHITGTLSAAMAGAIFAGFLSTYKSLFGN